MEIPMTAPQHLKNNFRVNFDQQSSETGRKQKHADNVLGMQDKDKGTKVM